jgi:hypothetical protein
MDLAELFQKKEPLCEELESRLTSMSSGMEVIHHPLMIEVMPSENMYAFYNQRLKVKKEHIENCLKENDIQGYVFMHEKPYRLEAFFDFVSKKGTPKDTVAYWETLSEIWTNSENNWQNLKVWKQLLSKNVKNRSKFMDADERKRFRELPNEFTIYRGCTDENTDGLNYTLDKEIAEWFSKRYSKKGYVIEKKVQKSEVFAYLNGRNEEEIIYLG